jgi:hypothetical protein
MPKQDDASFRNLALARLRHRPARLGMRLLLLALTVAALAALAVWVSW